MAATTKKRRKKTGGDGDNNNGHSDNWEDRDHDDDDRDDDTLVAPGKQAVITVSRPNLQEATFTLVGTAHYVQSKFSAKAIQIMKETQMLGSQATKGKKKEPKDFDGLFAGAIHYASEADGGWAGIPACGLRAALVDACRTVGFKMTVAKMSIFVVADGFDATEGTPLVKITKGKPEYCEHAVRIQNTTDIRVRAMWQPGWRATAKLRYDGDQFRMEDVANLLMRVGIQVGLGEGRPFSRSSAGMGWGTFELADR